MPKKSAVGRTVVPLRIRATPAQRKAQIGAEGTGFRPAQLRALGKRLRQLREIRSWSLKQLANASGVSIAAIQKIEMGAAYSGLLTVFALSEALGEPMDRLVRASRLETQSTKVVHAAIPRRPSIRLDLTGRLADPRLRGGIVALPAHGKRTFVPGAESGAMFAYLIEGRIKVSFADAAIEDLAAGDAIHLSVPEHMTWLNPFMRSALVLCITDPRKFPDTFGTGEFN